MFRLLFLKNIKTFTAFFLSRRLQGSIVHKSSLSKNKETAQSKPSKKSNQEIFFPSVQLEGIRDKVALVTGGTDGIGLRCVRELLTSGARGVMIADTDEASGYKQVINMTKEYGPNKAAFIEINPANYVLLKNAFISTINYYKGLDIVINNIKFREKNWEDQVDENIKGIVLSTQLCLEFMGRNNGGNGGILLNIASDYKQNSESCPLHLAVQDFIVRFDRSVATAHFNASNVKVLTICKATFDTIGCDLATIITKGSNGCVWMPC
ncbi:15-hydroxyprostaglandin dehydrogenase [NAD(+)]-like [Tenebrio molitor]|uniref:15-hydroxyprostaglandin dehydrogenase [NAD(+)]-like n=1 Tax=Tenebrio molitor TaxID=7067 RepID=UPI0036246ABE